MDAIKAAQEMLPAWVVWGNVLVYPALSFLLTLAAAWLAVRLASFPRRRMMEVTTWTEQARLTYPARVAARAVSLVAPLLCGGVAFLSCGPLNQAPSWVVGLLAGVAAYSAGLFVRWRLARRLGVGETALRPWLRGMLGDGLLFYPHLFIAFLLLVLLPNRVDALAVSLLIAGLVLMGLFACGGGLSLARVVGLARPLDEWLRRVVERATARTAIRPRNCYVIASSMTNALAYPLSKRLAFTEAATTVLTAEELEAVCAHELAHLAESWAVALGRVVPIPLLVALAAVRMVLASGGIAALSLLWLLLVVVSILLRRLSQIWEKQADRLATGHESERGTYARALEKIHAANLIPAVLSGRLGTHPNLYDRLLAAGVQPGYERPRPPPRWRTTSALALSFLLLWFGLMALPVGRSLLWGQGEAVVLCNLALGGEANEVSDLAYRHYRRADKEGAATLYRAATVLDPQSITAPVNLALTLANLGRCVEAEEAVEEAQARSRTRQLLSARDAQLLATAQEAVIACRKR